MSEFISEKIKPVTETISTDRMAAGEPGLPKEFIFRGKQIRVVEVLRQWKETGPCSHGSADRYVRKFWYKLKLDSGRTAKVYFLKSLPGNMKDAGWWLLSLH